MEVMNNSRPIKYIAILLFAIAVCVNLGGIAIGAWEAANMAKCLLMPLLCFSGFLFMEHRRTRVLYVVALLFHTVGDILLLYSGQSFFLAGLFAFLLGHIAYLMLLIGFLGTLSSSRAILLGVLPILFGWTMVRGLSVDGMLGLPVGIYAATLFLLILTGVFGMTIGKQDKWGWIVCGAILFTFSDLLIALGKFTTVSIPMRDLLIMFTYILAQILLTLGLVHLQCEMIEENK